MIAPELARPVGPVASAVLLALLLLEHPSVARADPAGAAERYGAAEEAFAHGAYRAAGEIFEAAYREDPRAASIYNAAVSWEAAGDGARAADDFASALGATDLGADQRADASRRLSELEPRVGRLDVAGPPDAKVAVAHVEGASLPVRVHLGAGRYTVRVTYGDGHTETREVVAAAGKVVAFDVTSTTESPPPTAPSLRTAGWVAIGGSAALAVVAVLLGEATLSARDAFDASGDTSQSDHDRAVALRTCTNLVWVGAATAGIAGVVLLSVGAPSGTQATAFAGPAGVGVRGRF